MTQPDEFPNGEQPAFEAGPETADVVETLTAETVRNRVQDLLTDKAKDQGTMDALFTPRKKLNPETKRKISLALRRQDPYGLLQSMTEDAPTRPANALKLMLEIKNLYRKGLQGNFKDETYWLDETEKKLHPLLEGEELMLLQDRWYGAQAFIKGLSKLTEDSTEEYAQQLSDLHADWVAMRDMARLLRSA